MDINDYTALFKSLSEPVRLRILYLLLEKDELCVCELVEALSLSQGVVSRHLAYLRNTNLLNTRKDGIWVYYQLADNNPMINELMSLFKHHGKQSKTLKSDLNQLESVSQQICN